MLKASASDISFNCPHCDGPLMTEASLIGTVRECPHCYAQFEIPEASIVDKERFVEAAGLRRVLTQVRDQEWEILRRKYRAAQARIGELEAELQRVQSEGMENRETAALRRQLSEVREQFAQANQAFIASRKQQDAVIERLRRELAAAREDGVASRKKTEEIARLLQAASEERARRRKEKSPDSPDSVARDLAGVADPDPAAASAETEEKKPGNSALVQKLLGEVAELRKVNAALRASSEKAQVELAELKERVSKSDKERHQFESALLGLEDGLRGVLDLIKARQGREQDSV